jgi:hypothetical protein
MVIIFILNKMQPLTLASRYAPVFNFCQNETIKPITIEKYLSYCQIVADKQIIQNPTSTMMYSIYNKLGRPKSSNDKYYLQFIPGIDWEYNLKGEDPYPVYAKVIDKMDTIEILYILLFSHTVPYNLFSLCGCQCIPYTPGAHQGDIKHMRVIINKNTMNVTRVYFGAHGDNSGEWKDVKDIQMMDDHPVAFSCLGDHSLYYDAGEHPRIFGAVNDHTEVNPNDYKKNNNQIILIHDQNDLQFNPITDGWLYWPGGISESHINAPGLQGWFESESTESNSVLKRLFCYKFW